MSAIQGVGMLAVRAAGYVLAAGGVGTRNLVASAAGTLMRRASRQRHDVTLRNIEHAFPELSGAEVRTLADSAYRNLGIVLAEVLAMSTATKSQLLRMIDVPGFELVQRRMLTSQPSILVSGHFGNWELLAVVAALRCERPFAIIVHPQHNAFADTFLHSVRSRFGNILIPMGSAARSIIRILGEGGTVAFLADQYADPRLHREVPFFGRLTPTYEAPAQLALRYRIPLFAAFAERMPSGSYVAPVSLVPTSDLTDSPEGVLECTARHTAMLENAIRRRPELWSWQHRRWRQT